LSYGVNGLLQAEPALARPALQLPVLQLNERQRYADLPPPRADLSRPGLVVDLERRLDPEKLKACFAEVGAPALLVRGAGRASDARYVAVPVSGARPNLLAQGCEAAE
jgi:hypothetical protein